MIRPTPSVAMKPWTSSRVTISPLARPISAATASAVSTPRTMLASSPAMIPPATSVVRLATYGTERSRLPARMTRVCPIEMKPSTVMAVKIVQRLPWLKKLRSLVSVSNAETTTIRPSTT